MRTIALGIVALVLFGRTAMAVEPAFFEIRLGTNDLDVIEKIKSDPSAGDAVLLRDLHQDLWAVSREVLVNAAGVANITVVPKNQILELQSPPLIEVTFNDSAATKVQRLTEAYQGFKIVVLIKGRVASGATLKGVFSKSMQVSLKPMSDSEAEAIVKEFRGET